VLKGRKRKRKPAAVKNGDSDETVESETGSGSVTTSSDLASPTKVTLCSLRIYAASADYGVDVELQTRAGPNTRFSAE